MNKSRMTWMLGTILSLSLVAAPAANAKKLGAGIVPAKRYQVTQITDKDVAVRPLMNSQARVGRVALRIVS
jgi:hypothetical protein